MHYKVLYRSDDGQLFSTHQAYPYPQHGQLPHQPTIAIESGYHVFRHPTEGAHYALWENRHKIFPSRLKLHGEPAIVYAVQGHGLGDSFISVHGTIDVFNSLAVLHPLTTNLE